MKNLLIILCLISTVYANELQSQLMRIASDEAKIANIGANKSMMLYGKSSPIPIINKWNAIEKKPNLTSEQISAINELEQQKLELIKSSK